MARKRKAAKPAETAVNFARTKLHKSAGDAVEILTGQLEVFAAASIETLRLWEMTRNEPEDVDPEYYLSSARELVQDCARLGQAIAAIKGESHNHFQHIRVERFARDEANVVTRESDASLKLLQTNAESGNSAEMEGEGGVPPSVAPRHLPPQGGKG